MKDIVSLPSCKTIPSSFLSLSTIKFVGFSILQSSRARITYFFCNVFDVEGFQVLP